ncbi:hypothetical protein FH972_026727 [Carpinus fangiana]|uniref:Uncharacterized protein n=1 Tax=Carpinus fangiana TaxID=176857 RepID=A0A5N6L593_9ROSI|nr:hypothetical protein FH972_026727 [Carpinus fangiana]
MPTNHGLGRAHNQRDRISGIELALYGTPQEHTLRGMNMERVGVPGTRAAECAHSCDNSVSKYISSKRARGTENLPRRCRRQTGRSTADLLHLSSCPAREKRLHSGALFLSARTLSYGSKKTQQTAIHGTIPSFHVKQKKDRGVPSPSHRASLVLLSSAVLAKKHTFCRRRICETQEKNMQVEPCAPQEAVVSWLHWLLALAGTPTSM